VWIGQNLKKNQYAVACQSDAEYEHASSLSQIYYGYDAIEFIMHIQRWQYGGIAECGGLIE
jgi:hypothetical protein